MTRDDVIERVLHVIQDTFDNEDVVYSDALTANDVEGWDSLSNIRFMLELEREFSIMFSVGQWQKLANLGDLVDHIMAKG